MDKFKDFKELTDTSEQSLRNLFVKRCYNSRINSPYANDIILLENFDSLPDSYVKGEVLTPEVLAELRTSKASLALQFPKDTDIEFIEHELSFLNSSEVEDYYIRKRVETYLELLKDIKRELYCIIPRAEKESKHEYKSLRRVYSFILAKAYRDGNTDIQEMSQKDFKEYVIKLFPDISSTSIYQTVRSKRKNESCFLLYFFEMSVAYQKDFLYAMKIYKDYFPESLSG